MYNGTRYSCFSLSSLWVSFSPICLQWLWLGIPHKHIKRLIGRVYWGVGSSRCWRLPPTFFCGGSRLKEPSRHAWKWTLLQCGENFIVHYPFGCVHVHQETQEKWLMNVVHVCSFTFGGPQVKKWCVHTFTFTYSLQVLLLLEHTTCLLNTVVQIYVYLF